MRVGQLNNRSTKAGLRARKPKQTGRKQPDPAVDIVETCSLIEPFRGVFHSTQCRPIVAKTDSALINEARDHVPEAWDILLKRHQLPLYTYTAELICDKAAAFDIVQETFAAAVQNIGSLRQEAKFSSWIFGIAHQKCMQHWRRVRREEKFFDPVDFQNELEDDVPGDVLDPRALLVQREQAGEFNLLLERLPAAQRSALLLYVLEDFTIEEIAAIADVPVGTIKSRLHNAKSALRKITKFKQ